MKKGFYIDPETDECMWGQWIRGELKCFQYVKMLPPEKIYTEFEMIGPLIEDTFTKIRVPDGLYEEILHDFLPRWAKAKMKESRFQMDHGQLVERGQTGFLGEAAIEVLLDTPVLDRDRDGKLLVRDSRDFHTSDLCTTGLDVGVKTVEWGKFPVVKRNVRRPQMISFRTGKRSFLVGGFASMKVLREHQTSVYVLNEALRNKRMNNGQIEKTCFWGFHQLIQIRSLKELRDAYYKR